MNKKRYLISKRKRNQFGVIILDRERLQNKKIPKLKNRQKVIFKRDHFGQVRSPESGVIAKALFCLSIAIYIQKIKILILNSLKEVQGSQSPNTNIPANPLIF
jgi:hypothetical protein